VVRLNWLAENQQSKIRAGAIGAEKVNDKAIALALPALKKKTRSLLSQMSTYSF